MSERNRAVLDRLNEEVLRGGNVGVLDELLAEDFVEHNPASGTGRDREGLKEFIRILHRAFADQVHTVDDQIVEGDRVVERCTMTATHAGEFMGIPPTGKRVTLPSIDISRLRNGRIVEHWMQADVLGLMAQLGAVPADEPVGA